MPRKTEYRGVRFYYTIKVLKHLKSLSGTFHLISFQLQLIVGEPMEKWANVQQEKACWQGLSSGDQMDSDGWCHRFS